MDKNYKIVIIKHICQQLCKSFVQVSMTVAVEPSDLGVGCLGWLMLVDCFSCVLRIVGYLLWHFDR